MTPGLVMGYGNDSVKLALIPLAVREEGIPVVNVNASSGREKVRLSISETGRMETVLFFHSQTFWLCAIKATLKTKKDIKVKSFFIVINFERFYKLILTKAP